MKNMPKSKNIITIMSATIIIILIILVVFLSIDRKNNDRPYLSEQSGSSEKENFNSATDNNSTPKNETESTSNSVMEQEISEAKSKSAYNKSQYEQKYQYYMTLDRYTGTQSSYSSKISSLNKAITQAYVDCQNKISSVYSSNLGSGFKESYKRQYENERDQKIRELSAEISDLKVAWENQQNYLKYYNLYLAEDEKLESEIKKIREKYN